MRAKRPCRVCRRWFRPDPRVGERQRCCSRPECQRERHRRNCVEWHRDNPDYDREERLRRRVVKAAAVASGDKRAAQAGGGLRIDWRVVRDEIGLQAAVILEESDRVLRVWARDEWRAQMRGKIEESSRLPP